MIPVVIINQIHNYSTDFSYIMIIDLLSMFFSYFQFSHFARSLHFWRIIRMYFILRVTLDLFFITISLSFIMYYVSCKIDEI